MSGSGGIGIEVKNGNITEFIVPEYALREFKRGVNASLQFKYKF